MFPTKTRKICAQTEKHDVTMSTIAGETTGASVTLRAPCPRANFGDRSEYVCEFTCESVVCRFRGSPWHRRRHTTAAPRASPALPAAAQRTSLVPWRWRHCRVLTLQMHSIDPQHSCPAQECSSSLGQKSITLPASNTVTFRFVSNQIYELPLFIVYHILWTCSWFPSCSSIISALFLCSLH